MTNYFDHFVTSCISQIQTRHFGAATYSTISAHFSFIPSSSSLTKLGLGFGFPKGNPNQKLELVRRTVVP